MSIEDIVNVQITRETAAVSRTGFGTPLILGVNKASTSLIKFYSNIKEVLEDFVSTDKEAVAATSIFSQSPNARQIAIGRRSTSNTTVVTVSSVIDNTDYTITVNGTAFTINSGGSATAASIAAALVAAITGVGVDPTDNLDGTFDLDPSTPGDDYSVKGESKLSLAFTTDDTLANDLTNISQESDDWYGLIYTLRTQSDVEAIAAYIETVKKIFITASNDANIVDTTDAADTTTVAAVLKAAAYARSAVMYLSNADTQFPEAALLGSILPLDPGSYTSAFKTLTGITADSLSGTQRKNALDKNVTIYTEVGGVNITEGGKVAEGEWIDVIIFVDWLDSRITEEVYGLLVNQPKVPFTDAGIAAVEAEISGVLQDGVAVGGIADDPAFSVTVPKAADVSATDKANRELNDVTFQATLAGAIHAVEINGTVTV